MKRIRVALNPPRRVHDFLVFAKVVAARLTMRADVELHGLLPGTVAWVRARAVTADEPSEWLAPVSTLVG